MYLSELNQKSSQISSMISSQVSPKFIQFLLQILVQIQIWKMEKPLLSLFLTRAETHFSPSLGLPPRGPTPTPSPPSRVGLATPRPTSPTPFPGPGRTAQPASSSSLSLPSPTCRRTPCVRAPRCPGPRTAPRPAPPALPSPRFRAASIKGEPPASRSFPPPLFPAPFAPPAPLTPATSRADVASSSHCSASACPRFTPSAVRRELHLHSPFPFLLLTLRRPRRSPSVNRADVADRRRRCPPRVTAP